MRARGCRPKLLLAELHHGIERQALPDAGVRPRAIRSRPPPGSRCRPVDRPCSRPTASFRASRLPSASSASNRATSHAITPGWSETDSPVLMSASSPRARRSRVSAWRRFCRAWASKCEPHNRVISLSRLCACGAVQARKTSKAASFSLVRSMAAHPARSARSGRAPKAEKWAALARCPYPPQAETH